MRGCRQVAGVGHYACVDWLEVGKLTLPWVPPGPPSPIIAVPAASVPDAVGLRAMVGTAGRGWRGDMRVVGGPSTADGRTVIEVAPEWEYYRLALSLELNGSTEIHPQVPVRLRPPPAPRHPVPIDRVWVEMPLTQAPTGDTAPSAPRPSPRAATVLDRIVSLDAPAAREPVPVRDMPLLAGRRLVIAQPDRPLRDIRATSEIHEHRDGEFGVMVCYEKSWYRWAMTGERIAPMTVPLHLAWVE